MGTTITNSVEIEARIRDRVSIDEPWSLVEKLSTLVRLSGNDDEREAIDYLTSKLDEFGVSYTLHTPTLFVSWPHGATLRVVGDNPLTKAFAVAYTLVARMFTKR